MPVSQLKRLKAQVHDQRQARLKGKPATSSSAAPASSAGKNGRSTAKDKKSQPPRETPQQRAHALRRDTLLPEYNRRRKVGGIIDRRIGEDDPTMAPEDRALRRFMAASQRQRKRTIFNLEDENELEDDDVDPAGILTHGGQALESQISKKTGPSTLGEMLDDYRGSDIGVSSDEDDGADAATRRERKRKRFQDMVDEAMEQRELEPERKKSKQEVMKEVIAKSKLHKYERQQAKEEDEDVRAELDKGMPDLLAALRGTRAKAAPTPPQKEDPKSSIENGIHPDRAARISDKPKQDIDKEYDQRLRQMVMDKRAQPTERTKTDEEKAEDEAARLLELEAQRLRRMRGEPDSEEDEDQDTDAGRELDDDKDLEPQDDEEQDADEARAFGLGSLPVNKPQPFDVEDEDDFVIDEDLVASGSDLDIESQESSDEQSLNEAAVDDADDTEFLQDILAKPDSVANDRTTSSKGLAYTYPCPQTHQDFLSVIKDVDPIEVPTIVQRIRALYHAQLHAGNKEKLSKFAATLIEHIAYMAEREAQVIVMESIIRHIHSLAKTHGDAVAKAFRLQLQKMHEIASLGQSQLVILTAIGSIYPTSDHFHQVVTPAITIMARWLCMTTPSTQILSTQGAYLVALAIKYLRLSKRYAPETIRFTLAALRTEPTSDDSDLVAQHVTNLSNLMDLWADQSAFLDIFSPEVGIVLAQPNVTRAAPKLARQTLQKLKIMLNQAQLRRRPLELHHHRPLPIKTSIPKFEENFNPGGHYEPDREKQEQARLRKEYKREHKGAMRELRRDAEFMAREQLRDKKERDRLYEERQRRIIGEIQREEGQARNEYEREKRRRKGRS